MAISTFSSVTSNAMHSEPSWSSVRRIGGGGLCTVGFSRANLCHGYCRGGRWRVRPTGFAVSTRRSTTSNSIRFAGRSGVAFRSVKRIGWSRSPVDWTSNRRYEHADARKRSPFQLTNETKSPDRFSSPSRHTRGPAVLFCDGAVYRLDSITTPDFLRAMVTIDSDEPISRNDMIAKGYLLPP